VAFILLETLVTLWIVLFGMAGFLVWTIFSALCAVAVWYRQ
jgi:hypothetical protein